MDSFETIRSCRRALLAWFCDFYSCFIQRPVPAMEGNGLQFLSEFPIRNGSRSKEAVRRRHHGEHFGANYIQTLRRKCLFVSRPSKKL
jgi:hypothetical protein